MVTSTFRSPLTQRRMNHGSAAIWKPVETESLKSVASLKAKFDPCLKAKSPNFTVQSQPSSAKKRRIGSILEVKSIPGAVETDTGVKEKIMELESKLQEQQNSHSFNSKAFDLIMEKVRGELNPTKEALFKLQEDYASLKNEHSRLLEVYKNDKRNHEDEVKELKAQLVVRMAGLQAEKETCAARWEKEKHHLVDAHEKQMENLIESHAFEAAQWRKREAELLRRVYALEDQFVHDDEQQSEAWSFADLFLKAMKYFSSAKEQIVYAEE